jgi:hypothetical protein
VARKRLLEWAEAQGIVPVSSPGESE